MADLNLERVIPALITPFNQDEKIKKNVIKQVIDMCLEKGVAGFYVGGSSAETFLQSTEERKEIIKTAVDACNGRCYVIAHIGCVGTKNTIELAKYAKEAGADAVSAIPPFYYKHSVEEIKRHYVKVIEESKMKMIIYNFPRLSGFEFNSENAADLFKHPMVCGLKYTSTELFKMERIINKNPDLTVYSGFDETLAPGMLLGATGTIGTTYNFMPQKAIKVCERIKNGDAKGAMVIQTQMNNIIEGLIKVGVYQGVKYALAKMGIDAGVCRMPFKNMSNEDKLYLDKILEKNDYNK